MVRRALIKDCTVLAKLHISGLRTGFLSELGAPLLSSLYRYLIIHQKVWVYEENGKVLGFISLSLNGHGMMRQFVIQNPLFLMRFFVRILFKPALLKKAFETFKAPVKSSVNSEISRSGLDMPELLSIAVSNKVQAKGIGTALLQVLEAYLRDSNYLEYYLF